MLLLLLAQAQSPDIVVTGQRLIDAQAACVRGGCTTLRDIQASIAVAEARFREGAYLKARKILAAAVSRNRSHAATDPKPVAALYEAYATVALHEGDQEIYKRAVAGQVRTLRDNLPRGDPSVVAAVPALGDMWIKLGNYRQADATYRSAEQDAEREGEAGAAAMVTMKRAMLAAAMGEPARARRMIDALAARPIGQDPAYRLALRVVRLRIDAKDLDDAQMKAMAEEIRAGEIGRGPVAEPALLWAPSFTPDAIAAANAQARKFGQPEAIPVAPSDLGIIQWLDIGFWIRPDGRTADVQILRSSRGNPWTAIAIGQVEARRYTVFSPASGSITDQGVYRIERITKRSHYVVPSGSLVRRRVSMDGFEILDLTGPPAPKAG